MSYVIFTLIQLPLWVSLSDFSISIFEGIIFSHVVPVLPLQSDCFADISLIPLCLHHKLCWTPIPTPCTMSNSAFTISYNAPLTSSLSTSQVFPEFQFLFPGILVLISSLCQSNFSLYFWVPAGGITKSSNKKKGLSPCLQFKNKCCRVLFWLL